MTGLPPCAQAHPHRSDDDDRHQHIAALRLRNGFDKLFPVIRKDLIRPESVQPVKIHLPAQEDAAQNQGRDMIG